MKLGFIGAGKMAEAYISALKDENDICFYDISEKRSKYMIQEYNIDRKKTINNLINNSEYIILSIKPNIMKDVLKDIHKINCDLKSKYLLSIAAGIKIEEIKSILPESRVVRIMPNTPALIKKGVSGVVFDDMIKKSSDKEKIKNILSATGKVMIMENEDQIDILTGISGSGPAYVFLLINSLAEGGVKLGMKKEKALELAVETFIGSAELIKQTGKHPEELKDMVTSPGGSTAAGLFTLENNKVRKALIETVEATYKKVQEL
ncbi:MAG: pyrroline-5-carboxylate reductase [Fusobacteriota bacterium]